MQKIPTFFERGDSFKVIPKGREECQWVFAGEGIPTEKLDGTNIRITVHEGVIVHVEKRRNPTKNEKAVGMEPGYIDAIRNDPSDKHIFRAIDGTIVATIPDGQYEAEAVGPKIQGNPLKLEQPTCYLFNHNPIVLEDCPRDFDSIRDYVLNLESVYSPGVKAEGIVYHHPDGRMAKIKRRDF